MNHNFQRTAASSARILVGDRDRSRFHFRAVVDPTT
jgi:hypothetical protein